MFQFNTVKNDALAYRSGTMNVGMVSWLIFPHDSSSLLSKVARKNHKYKYDDGTQGDGKNENGGK